MTKNELRYVQRLEAVARSYGIPAGIILRAREACGVDIPFPPFDQSDQSDQKPRSDSSVDAADQV